MGVSCPSTSLARHCGRWSSLYESCNRHKACDLPNVKEVVASGLDYDDSIIAGMGVAIAILGVDIAILGVDMAILGVDIAILRRREKG